MADFLLTNPTGAALYHRYAERLPIIDFHCHLRPDEILRDAVFEDLGEIWLKHDHYKWRCMRTFGIDEALITGPEPFERKFLALAEIMPMLAGNPVYDWCHLELRRYFAIEEPLSAATAPSIYRRTLNMIREKRMSPRTFIAASNVEYIATTDDPADDLSAHEALANDKTMKTQIAPAFRPDNAMNIVRPGFAAYIARLQAVCGAPIDSFTTLMDALDRRMAFFKAHGARVTDHGVDSLTVIESTPEQRDAILSKALSGAALTGAEVGQYQTAFLIGVAALCAKHGLAMQLHLGACRNINGLMYRAQGADAGFDACGDPVSVRGMGQLLSAMNDAGALPRMMLYPIDGAQFEPLAVLAAAFSTGPVKARVSLGAPWWFGDQVYGIRRQFEAAGQVYPLALSPGMVTDSRSFLSYPRHELYRRVLCDYLGELVEKGAYVSGDAALGRLIEAVCYRNAKAYLGL